jgi:hypothetical protein
MTLREKQSLFAELVAQLIIHAGVQGYEVTLGEAYRSPEEAARLAKTGAGIKASLHTDRLAIDLNLFKDGRWLRSSEAHRPLGVWWENLHELCRWGGRFKDSQGRPKPDGNHYSLTHEGRA